MYTAGKYAVLTLNGISDYNIARVTARVKGYSRDPIRSPKKPYGEQTADLVSILKICYIKPNCK